MATTTANYNNPVLRDLNNYNEAIGNVAQLIIPDFDNLNYFIQSFNFPAIDIPAVETPFKGNDNKQVGDFIKYGTLSVDIAVDEDLANLTALFDWIKKTNFKANVSERYVDVFIKWRTRNLKHDIEIKFHNAFITNIGGFQLSTLNTEDTIITTNVSFEYQYMTLNGLEIRNPNIHWL